MTHYQDPREQWYTQPACGARPIWTGGTWCDRGSPNITCKACQAIAGAANAAPTAEQ